jgi:hypothetical protein
MLRHPSYQRLHLRAYVQKQASVSPKRARLVKEGRNFSIMQESIICGIPSTLEMAVQEGARRAPVCLSVCLPVCPPIRLYA